MLETLSTTESNYAPIYDEKLSIKEKIEIVAKKIYGADSVNYTKEAEVQIKQLEELNLDKKPVCMAKTQYSLSDDAKKIGRPIGFDITVREVKVSNGAGFIVVITGDVLTMPGLPKVPAAENIDINVEGKIIGIF